MAEARADRRIRFELDLYHVPQHAIADVHRIADRLQRQCVLLHACHEVEPPIAACEHEMFIGHDCVAREGRGAQYPSGGAMAWTLPITKRPRFSAAELGLQPARERWKRQGPRAVSD